MEKGRCSEELFEKLLARELSDAESASLLSHAAECGSCRQLFFLNLQLSSSELSPPPPSKEVLDEMRRRVLDRITEQRSAAQQNLNYMPPIPAGRKNWISTLRVSWKAAALAYGSLMLVLGTAVGWGFFRWTEPNSEEMLIAEIARKADTNQHLADSNDSPYIFSNVSLRRIDAKTVTFGFDLTTHLEVTRERNDPLLKEVIVQALTASPSIGERLKAISFSEGMLNGKVKQGLFFAARRDPNQAVRLKALSVLMNQPNDPEVQSLCLSILHNDESVQMRLQAVDCLGKAEGGPAVLERLIQNQEWHDVPLRVRAANYLR
jgi:hypothetical protein